MTVRLKRDEDGLTDDARVRRYVLKHDVWDLARMLVKLENVHTKTIRLRLVKGK